MQIKNIIFIFLLFVLLPLNVLSYSMWYSDGMASYFPYTLYSNQQPTLINTTNASYTQCTIGGSDFESQIYDLNNDGEQEIFSVDSDVITIYDTRCNVLSTYTADSYVRSPVMLSFNDDDWSSWSNADSRFVADPCLISECGYFGLIVGNSTEVFKFTTNTITLIAKESWNITIFRNISRVDYGNKLRISPRGYDQYGFVFPAFPSQDFYLIHYYGFNQNPKVVIAQGNYSHYTGYKNAFNTFTDTQGSLTGKAVPYYDYLGYDEITPICFLRDGVGAPQYFYCNIIDYAGNSLQHFTILSTANYFGYSLNNPRAEFAKLGSNVYLFISGQLDQLTGLSAHDYYFNYNAIYDFYGNQKASWIVKNYEQNLGFQTTTNWIVNDINKDGFNEACFNYFVNTSSGMLCYDKYLNVMNYTDTYSINDSVTTICSFDSSQNNSWLSVGSSYGIYFSPTASNFTQKYSSGLTSYGGSCASINEGNPPNNIFLYQNDDAGYIAYLDPSLVADCGNGVCELGESEFNCAADCVSVTTEGSVAVGYYCVNNSQCYTGYCVSYVCTLLPYLADCLANNQCLSGSCQNGKCTKPSLGQEVQQTKDDYVGDDDDTNNILSWIIIGSLIVLSIIIGVALGSAAVAGVCVGFSIVGGIILCVSLGWLNPLYLISLIIIFVMVILYAFLGK